VPVAKSGILVNGKIGAGAVSIGGTVCATRPSVLFDVSSAVCDCLAAMNGVVLIAGVDNIDMLGADAVAYMSSDGDVDGNASADVIGSGC